MKRIPELDIFRAIAIFLVLLLHVNVATITTRIGWAGVDLFFVLSGFLVSGLLFNEYKVTGNIRPFYFLIRRGFKIYPLFYFVLLLHILYYSFKGISLHSGQITAEIFFFQNYKEGLMGISWSLAIEEHFYILLLITVFIAWKKNKIQNSMAIPASCFLIAIICLSLRLYTYWDRGYYSVFINDFPTHLRMDSLAFGVLLSYWYHFHYQRFINFFTKYKNLLLVSGFCLFIPVFIWERQTFIISTFGYSFLYFGFGIFISLTLTFTRNIRQRVNETWFATPYKFMVWIGLNSYAIYLCHFILGAGFVSWVKHIGLKNLPEVFYLLFYLASTILGGVLLTKLIEKPFLKMREKFFPLAK